MGVAEAEMVAEEVDPVAVGGTVGPGDALEQRLAQPAAHVGHQGHVNEPTSGSVPIVGAESYSAHTSSPIL